MADEIDTAAHPSAATPGRPLGEADNENSVGLATQRVGDRAEAASVPPPHEPAQSARRPREEPTIAGQASRFSVERGDVPDQIKRRYYSEEPQFAPELRFYTDAKTKEPAFRDVGDKLVARENNAEVIKDLVAIAQHRGWSTIDVNGANEFRREAWITGRTAGLEVNGYKPSERDVQELERRLNARDANSVAPSGDRNPAPEARDLGLAGAPGATARSPSAPAVPERLDYSKGVTGKLLESGELPYRHRSGQELTPFVKVEQASGRQVEVWGVGLPAALERSGATIGDEITLRKDGVEKVSRTFEVTDKATGQVSLMQREVPRNRWTIEAERFRASTPAEAARDPSLREAQSQLAVVAAVVKSRHPDPATQERLIAGAKEKIADHIENGARFGAAKVSAPEFANERPTPERSKPPERDIGMSHAEVQKGSPERTRGR